MSRASLTWHVGDVVRKLREHRRWTQSRLAQAAGLNRSTVVKIEEGGNVQRTTLEAVARGLGVSVADLYRLLPGEGARQPGMDRDVERPAGAGFRPGAAA
ncbi:MAG TPA: helix-turn-helix transcriptional regulator, partial [Vicinamibacterales bacterium]|nr:helix-turn-helix transcriptional regulator [Vicinamibacterales bacterium]